MRESLEGQTMAMAHAVADLIALAAILRIPVAMHNVGAQSIFRPKYWGCFGDPETGGADYRACAALGPLYGR